MENFDDEYSNYCWDQMPATMIFQNDELDWTLEEAFSAGSGESSSPDGAATSPASKNVVSERNRRQKLNQRLFALRSVVPNISKLDKASIIKDSIDYIQNLHDQEKRLETEIKELESRSSLKNLAADSYDYLEFDQELPSVLRSKKIGQIDYSSVGSRKHSLIEVLEMKVTSMGEKVVVVSITCSKKTDTMVKLCEVFESLNLKVMTANLTSFSARVSMTVFLEAEEDEIAILESKIQTAIAAFNDAQVPMCL